MIIIKYKKNYKLVDGKITIRSIMKKDLRGEWWKWLNDKKVTHLMDKGYSKNTIKKQRIYYQKIKNSKKDILFAVCKNKKHIGCVGLHKINKKKKEAQFGILIGNRRYHGKGIGAFVWKRVVDFGFQELKLKKINTMIVHKNYPSLRIANSIGFKKKICLKNYIKKGQEKFDYIKLTLKENEFKKKNYHF